MLDRQRAEKQTDIDFDFFDESPTVDGVRKGDGKPKRRRKLPQRPPAPPGGPRLYRLGLLVAGAIVLAAILIVAVVNCRGDRAKAEYVDYIDSVTVVATESQQLGVQLNDRLTTPGIAIEALRGDIEGLRDQQGQILRSTRELTPPGPLLEQHESLIDTMQFRVNGLDGIARGLAQVAQTTDADESGELLARQSQRLVASDVVFADAFAAPAQTILEQQDVTDVSVPESVFVQNVELGSPSLWTQIVQRLTQSPEAGGLHGNGIAGVRVQPGGEQLTAGEDNTVAASDSLAFQVLIENSGDFQETQVPVTLVIQQDPVIRKRQVVDVINPGETKTVTFRDLGNVTFSTRTTLKITVEPVSGEQNVRNNTAEYAVIFTLQ
ncbi:MAG TPA: CARDB domain-containing protein [Gaiellaceae bacterium]|nr:CARDB domain-containing protein [Gaiellaceae bacterium]